MTSSKTKTRRLADLNLFISNLKDMRASYNSLVTDLKSVQAPPTNRQLNNLTLQMQQFSHQRAMNLAQLPVVSQRAPHIQTVSPIIVRNLQIPKATVRKMQIPKATIPKLQIIPGVNVRKLQTPNAAPATSATAPVQPKTTSASTRIIPNPTSNLAATTNAAPQTADSGNSGENSDPNVQTAPEEPKSGTKSESGADNAEDASWLRWPVGIYMILIGIPLCFKGYAWFQPWMAIPLGILLGLEFEHKIQSASMEGVQATAGWNVLWITVAILFAAAFSVVFWFLKKLGAALLLSYVFMLIGTLICGLVNTFMTVQMEKWIALVIVICFLIGGFMFGWFRPKFVLVGTAIAGAYNFVGGIGTLSSQFPVWDADQEGVVWW